MTIKELLSSNPDGQILTGFENFIGMATITAMFILAILLGGLIHG